MRQYRANNVEIAAQAAEWLHSVRTGEAQGREGFADWLLESRRHVRAALFTIAVEKELEQFDTQLTFDIDALLTDKPGNVVSLDQRSSAQVPPAARSEKTARIVPRWPWSSAAAVLCIAVLLPLWHFFATSDLDFSTSTGQQQSVKLEDGSLVHLNTESHIKVEFSEHERSIRLLAGEALFDVQPEAGRPFQVHTNHALIRALGTQFNVYDRPDGDTRVSVLEGRVQVSTDTGRGQILSTGEEVRIAKRGTIESQLASSIKRRTAWRERRLEFQEDPLSKVVTEFNRYNREPQLRLESETIGARKYTGIFSADDPDSLAQVLSEERDLIVERKEREIVIRSR